ncbi:MAG: hypothetical protein FWG10_06230 [Eubacteriaceae bacterium]|nr:hypothetical protein [Eubacteriaceae bacterium]
MLEAVKALQDERILMYKEHYNNTIPKRMPMRLSMPNRVIAESLGLSGIDFNYDASVLDEAKLEIARTIFSDQNPFSAPGIVGNRFPGYYQLLRSQSFVMSNTGFTQHPEVIGMDPGQYPKLIEDPIGLLFEDVLPTHYKSFAVGAVGAANYFMMASSYTAQIGAPFATINAQLAKEHGYWPGAPRGSGGSGVAPFDFIADQLRSFSGISTDIRRNREALKEACDVMVPLMFNWSLPPNPDPQGQVRCPLHMPTYMREKDFVELWMPSFQKIMEQWAARGVRTGLFCEHDWTRFFDVIQDMPHGVEIQFEYGDTQEIKDKVGKKFLLTGMYPITMVGRSTKQQVLDKAKQMLDILMPGGGYIFYFDKNPLYLGDVNFENMAALGDFVHEYAVYDNPGQSYGWPVNYENFAIDPSIEVLPKSKYLHDWDGFKAEYPLAPDFAAPMFKQLQKETLNSFLDLLR